MGHTSTRKTVFVRRLFVDLKGLKIEDIPHILNHHVDLCENARSRLVLFTVSSVVFFVVYFINIDFFFVIKVILF